MSVKLSSGWTQALETYRYAVRLRDFADAGLYPGWFSRDLSNGDRHGTSEFESYFRANAANHIEPWLEVAFWKLYSQPAWRDNLPRQMAAYWVEKRIIPETLLEACLNYTRDLSSNRFNLMRETLGMRTPVVAVPATYPAFLRPDLFPMVDTRVAKWVRYSLMEHNLADPSGPQLVTSNYPENGQTALTMSDFLFTQSWVKWCKYTAQKLSTFTSVEWRARDVEMAVFNAWGDRNDDHPKLRLEPLPAS
ncbi:MAG: hypothetical protein HY872_17030 [Chloroflexi bacterium]|nr:hypothetical protein [Chloroflexota bacterium]